MPKLAKKKAASVAEQEGQAFEVLPEGTYSGKLAAVTVEEGPKGPYWKWEFTDITGISGEGVVAGKRYPGRQWNNTSLSDDSEWKLKEAFDAFGYTTDSDTDEIVGEKCKLVISIGVVNKGPRQGEKTNNIDKCLPLDDEESGGSGEDDTF